LGVLVACPEASAAPVFTTLGQVATAANSLSQGGCSLCTALQFASPGAVPYSFPYDGVITRWNIHTGQAVSSAGQWARARTFHVTDSSHATVVSEGAQAAITTTNTTLTTWDRVPAAAGDVLGLELASSAFVDDTRPMYADGAAAGEVAGVANADVGVGQSATATGVDSNRVNISARFEHDTDHDGYGDGSQDLCTNDPAHGNQACTGTLFASDLQGRYTSGGPCNYQCPRVQTTTAGGVSTSPSADGVVVRWRLQAPSPGTYLVRVISPADGGYTVTASSDPVTIGADEALWTFSTRLPIPAGGYVAMLPPSTASQRWLQSAPAGATWTSFNDAPSGPVALAASVAGVSMYDADIEPDADHDGYGDVTQDACPSDATTEAACPAPPPPGGTSPPPPAQQPAAVRITSLRLRRARFRVARKGRVIAAKTHAGSAILVGMSAPARVRFTVRACRSKKGCARTRLVHRFTRSLRIGTTSIAYSGRFRLKRRVRSLTAGRYRLDAAVVPESGPPGIATSRAFTVVR
jgi:hypothetical protein